ncbi:MAG: TlpA family protein disulfide reductase [Verrucomicrobiae bacterium]|nr:TlpA family protein disulfide reductase [Verrucomicrobiae bacterium]
MRWLVVALCVLCGCVKQAGRPPIQPVTASQLLELVRAPGAKVVLVNVYAIWCGPCREEFPDLVRLEENYRGKGLRVLFVSADDESDLSAVRKFLREQGVGYTTYLKAQADMEFISGLDQRWEGALPATFIYDGRGGLRDFWVGTADYRTFEQKIKPILEEHS